MRMVYILTVEGDKAPIFSEHNETMKSMKKILNHVNSNGCNAKLKFYEPSITAQTYHEFGKVVSWLWKELKEIDRV